MFFNTFKRKTCCFFFVKWARTKCQILSRLSKGSRRLVQTTSFVKCGAHIISHALFLKKDTKHFSNLQHHKCPFHAKIWWIILALVFLARNFFVFFFLNQTIIISKLKFDPSFSFHMPYVCSRETIMLDFSCIQHKCFVSSIVKILWHILSIFACQYIILQHHMITNIVVCNS